MRQNRSITMISLIVFAIMMAIILVVNNVAAQEGPKNIFGRVYTSDGEPPPEGFDGTYAAVIVEHDGGRSTYLDLDGLNYEVEDGNYWYGVTIPAGSWVPGDRYWIVVDGTGWGDTDEQCVSHNNPNINDWNMDAAGTEEQDVNTAATPVIVNDVVPDYLTILGIICVIAIIVAIPVFIFLRRKRHF